MAAWHAVGACPADSEAITPCRHHAAARACLLAAQQAVSATLTRKMSCVAAGLASCQGVPCPKQVHAQLMQSQRSSCAIPLGPPPDNIGDSKPTLLLAWAAAGWLHAQQTGLLRAQQPNCTPSPASLTPHAQLEQQHTHCASGRGCSQVAACTSPGPLHSHQHKPQGRC